MISENIDDVFLFLFFLPVLYQVYVDNKYVLLHRFLYWGENDFSHANT